MANSIISKVDRSAITPLIGENDIQIIYQRHCEYDRESGCLLDTSVELQKALALAFMEKIPEEKLGDIYFLFGASNTSSGYEHKRCVGSIQVVMDVVKKILEEKGIPKEHIINLDDTKSYDGVVHQNRRLTEPGMFIDETGFYDYLLEKHGGMNIDFWTDFEEDLSKEKRLLLGSEGVDDIVDRGVRYLNVLQRYAKWFKATHAGANLIIWEGTHYDVISPLVKQKVLNCDKSEYVGVEYCGGMSFVIDAEENITAVVNGVSYPFDAQYSKRPRQHF